MLRIKGWDRGSKVSYLEDGKHAAGRDVVAVDESQSVGDRVPHALNRATRTAKPDILFGILAEG